MCAGSDDAGEWACLLRDPLIRLVMRSDGVTDQAMIEVMTRLRRSLADRGDPPSSATGRTPPEYPARGETEPARQSRPP